MVNGKTAKRLIVLVVLTALLVIGLMTAAMAAPSFEAPGPAPNAGDGVSDGSGLDAPFTAGPRDAGDQGADRPGGAGL